MTGGGKRSDNTVIVQRILFHSYLTANAQLVVHFGIFTCTIQEIHTRVNIVYLLT